MKRLKHFRYFVGVCIISVCTHIGYAQSSELPKTSTDIEFEHTLHSFNTLFFDDPATHTFRFKNTGAKPLIISSIKNTCGCHIISYSEQVEPGEWGTITIIYNTRRIGEFSKGLTIYSNAENSPHIVTIQGTVIQKK